MDEIDDRSRMAVELARILEMATEYCEAHSSEDPERIRIICHRIDEQCLERFPPAGSPDQTTEPGKVIPFLPPLPKAG
jgi:hypothetical protein